MTPIYTCFSCKRETAAGGLCVECWIAALGPAMSALSRRIAIDITSEVEYLREENARLKRVCESEFSRDVAAVMLANSELQSKYSIALDKIVKLNVENADYSASFDLRWKADMRAIERWRAANPGNDLVMPDHADLCVWLLEQLDEASRQRDGMKAIEVEPGRWIQGKVKGESA